jgi:hypothetical protein
MVEYLAGSRSCQAYKKAAYPVAIRSPASRASATLERSRTRLNGQGNRVMAERNP